MATVWIDALEFKDYGGFTPETQFVQEMGQGYLFACKVPGIPVEDASTCFTVSIEGKYRIWTRVKNWYKQASPGRLKVLIDKAYLSRELGALPTEQWSWEAAGDVHLTAGDHLLTVQDTTGYFGRFAAMIITDDLDYTPEHKVERLWKERAQIRGVSQDSIPCGNFEVIVAGGGPAGVPAAIAAARKGMKVALLHSRPGLGGNASDEASVGFDGAYAVHPNMRETGIAEEIRRVRDHEGLSWEGALKHITKDEPNLSIFYNQFLIDAEVQDNIIQSVKTVNCMTGEFSTYRASMFIDCTGDGWLGYYSGARYRIGREAKWQYNEDFAPESPDNLTMSGCLMGTHNHQQILGYYAEYDNEPSAFTAPAWAVQLPEGDDLYRSPNRLHTGEWWVENPTDMDDLWEQEHIRDELLRLSLGYFHWVKNSYSRRDLARKLKIAGFGRYNAKRETRRLIGDYVLTQNDCTGARFTDAVSYCGWPLDVHHPKGIYSGKEGPYYSNSFVPISEIPFRCLYSKNIENLMMAGRCMSVSHLALGTVRVENTLATLGQVAGTAAALCIQMNTNPRGIYQDHIRQLQQLLLKDDLHIPSIINEDENDLAQKAQVTADSFSKTEHMNLKKGVPGDWVELNVAKVMSQVNSPTAQFAKVYIKNVNQSSTILSTAFVAMDTAADYEHMEIISQGEVLVAAGYEGWLDLPLSTDTDKKAVGILIQPVKGMYWKGLDTTSFQKYRGHQINPYRWQTDNANSFMTKMFEEPLVIANCAPENVINGYSRIIDTDRYAWVSDPKLSMPQSIQLTWDASVTLSSIQVVFDTDLINPSYSYVRLPNAAKCVSDYTVEVLCDGRWIKVGEGINNYMRKAVHHFNPRNVNKMRIIVTKTCGDPSARIFEIRAYA